MQFKHHNLRTTFVAYMNVVVAYVWCRAYCVVNCYLFYKIHYEYSVFLIISFQYIHFKPDPLNYRAVPPPSQDIP